MISSLIEDIFSSYLDASLETTKLNRNIILYYFAKRIYSLFDSTVSEGEKIESSMYIQSYLQGFNMANIYLLGSDRIKKEMCNYVNRVFEGNRSVEDMLDYYESNYQDVPKKLELIRKPFSK